MDEIVELLWKRDESALEIMEHQYGGFCRRIVSGMLGNIQDVEEAMNDIRMRIWNSIPPAKPQYFSAYLAKTARNTAVHYIEHENAQKRSGITVLLDELAECIPDPTAEQEINSIALRTILNQFVRSLRTEERSFFLRRYYFGESIRDIAVAYQCPENRVAVTLHRVRKKMRDWLEKEGYSL